MMFAIQIDMGTWSDCIYNGYLSPHELQAGVLMPHGMGFLYLSGEVASLHLYVSTGKAYICNQGGTVLMFLSRLAGCILSQANKCGITLIPTYILIHVNIKADYCGENWLLGSIIFLT